MKLKSDNPDSLFTLPFVLGVIVVLGGIGALLVSSVFVYRAHAVNAETHRIQASLEADRQWQAEQQENAPTTELFDPDDAATEPPVLLTSLETAELENAEQVGEQAEAEQVETITVTALKPGVRLHAQRPAHWDEAEIVDVLEDQKVKVRWLSGEPGEAVIAAELVRSEAP